MFQSLLKYIGYLLYDYRCGDAELAANLPEFKEVPWSIKLTSQLINEGDYVPVECAGSILGDNLSPPFDIEIEEDRSKMGSLALFCQDIDVMMRHPVVHMIAYDLEPVSKSYELGEFTKGKVKDPRVKLGKLVLWFEGYLGPFALPGHGDHRYVFLVLGIDHEGTKQLQNLGERPGYGEVIEIAKGHTVAKGKLLSRYTQDEKVEYTG